MAREPVAFLEDMLTEVRYLRQATSDRELDAILEDETLRRAIERSLAILGEAAKAVPEAVQQRWSEIPWSEMARMRDFLAHAYHRAEPAAVWRTAVDDAAPLVELIESALDGEKAREGSR